MLLSKTEQEKETQIISAVKKKVSTHLKTLKIKQNDINFMLIKLTVQIEKNEFLVHT